MATRTIVSNKLTRGIRMLNSILSSKTPDKILVRKLTAPLKRNLYKNFTGFVFMLVLIVHVTSLLRIKKRPEKYSKS